MISLAIWDDANSISINLCYLCCQGLVTLNFLQEKKEADFRYGLVRVRENAESIAFYSGEENEMQLLLRRFESAFENLTVWTILIFFCFHLSLLLHAVCAFTLNFFFLMFPCYCNEIVCCHSLLQFPGQKHYWCYWLTSIKSLVLSFFFFVSYMILCLKSKLDSQSMFITVPMSVYFRTTHWSQLWLICFCHDLLFQLNSFVDVKVTTCIDLLCYPDPYKMCINLIFLPYLAEIVDIFKKSWVFHQWIPLSYSNSSCCCRCSYVFRWQNWVWCH